MTTLATTPAARTRPPVGSPPRWRDLWGAEWIKFWSLRSNLVVLTAVPVLVCLIAYKTAGRTYEAWPGYPDSFRRIYEAGHDALFPPLFTLLMALAGTIGAQTVLGELTSGLIRTTFIAVPHRSRVLIAKAGVVTAVLTGLGVLVAVPSWAVTLAAYSGRVTGFSWTSPGVGRFLLASVVVFPVSGLIGMAVAALVRHTAATVFALFITFVGLSLAPLSSFDTALHTGRLFTFVGNSLPFAGWIFLTTLGNTGNIVGHHPSAVHAWIAYGAWAVGSVAVVVAAFRSRDV
ncbi:hypothetical protein [Kitasatospora sp. NPDC101183]|uniref:hypothetical protein n=1 Tax=Kitasatospora sp. NPDC101183 TaxID=3364100 RepID=UPI003803BA1B